MTHRTTAKDDKTNTNTTKKSKPQTHPNFSTDREKLRLSAPPLTSPPSFSSSVDSVTRQPNTPPPREIASPTCATSSLPTETASSPHVSLPPPPEWSIARDTSVLFLSDSSLRNINISQSDVQVECISELTVPSLTQCLTRQSPVHSMRQVTFHVGINDCCGRSTEKTGGIPTQQWRDLITQCQRVFPKARLLASAIIPAKGRNPLNTIIRPSNDHLHQACQALGVSYVDHCAAFTTQSGAPRQALYYSAIYPSRKGLERVAQHLFPSKRPLLPTPQPRQVSPVTNTRRPTSPLLPSHTHRPTSPLLPSHTHRPTSPLLPSHTRRPASPLLSSHTHRRTSPLLPPPLNHSDFPALPAFITKRRFPHSTTTESTPSPHYRPSTTETTPSPHSQSSPETASKQACQEGESRPVPVPGLHQPTTPPQNLPEPRPMLGQCYPPPPTWRYAPSPPPSPPMVPLNYLPRPLLPPHHPWYWPFFMPPPPLPVTTPHL